ncbi:MAG: hypothetical protein FGM24_10290, partial [Candidatus Kapabacteria bacterium]|nr:hypothetical protein [Candidatus Kapabacteria bacterium]
MGQSKLHIRTRRSIYGALLLLCCCTSAVPAFAQRLRDRVVWARERYAIAFDGADKLSTFNTTLKEWDIHDTLGLAAPIENARPGTTQLERLPGSPNYDVNYENVIFLGAGVFTNVPDTTYNRLERLITPIPSTVIVQNGRMGHGGAFSANKRVLQVFTIESRPFTVRDPTDTDVRNSWAYRQQNREGLGLRYIPQASFPGSAAPPPVIDPAKINVMVGGAAVVHPYILRYNDTITDPATIRAVVVADVTGDARDEIVMYRRTSGGMEVVLLETPIETTPLQPLDYMLQPKVVATIPMSVIDPNALRSVVAGDINGDGRTDLVHIVSASSGTPQRFVVATPAAGWTFTDKGSPNLNEVDFSMVHSAHAIRIGLGGGTRHSIALV